MATVIRDRVGDCHIGGPTVNDQSAPTNCPPGEIGDTHSNNYYVRLPPENILELNISYRDYDVDQTNQEYREGEN